MPSILSFFRPAPHIPLLDNDAVQRMYPRFRWQILESTFIGYAVFYFVRNNLPVVSKEMGQALGYSKGQIGDLLAVTAITYGLGKFLMGAVSDRSNPRYFMPAGLLLTALCNFLFGGSSDYHKIYKTFYLGMQGDLCGEAGDGKGSWKRNLGTAGEWPGERDAFDKETPGHSLAVPRFRSPSRAQELLS